MADLADNAVEVIDEQQRLLENQARQAAFNIPVGEPGHCEECGDWSQRLVNRLCAPCRDDLGLG